MKLSLAILSLLSNLPAGQARWYEEGDSSSSSDSEDDEHNDGGTGGGTFNPAFCTDVSPSIRLWTEAEVKANRTNCNVIIYDRVYNLDAFIPIHRGGAEPILRNCGSDATFLFENLQCIPSVPDHFEGMLSMCDDYIVGVIQGSIEDPCANDNYPPEYALPPFDECDTYHNITCADLGTGANYKIRPDRVGDLGVVGGVWADVAAVAKYQAQRKQDDPTSTICLSVLYGWVFDFGNSPLDGSAAFYLKHGAGLAPDAILRYCGADMTAAFEAAVPGGCVPLHTLGALNAVSGYVVGVIDNTEFDPCTNAPPDPCTEVAHSYYSLDGQGYPNFRYASSGGCNIVILGKVYDLATFAPYHWGGEEKITRNCGKDMTEDWLDEDEHIPLFHLGSLRDFQVGLIHDGVSDPCSDNYDETQDF